MFRFRKRGFNEERQNLIPDMDKKETKTLEKGNREMNRFCEIVLFLAISYAFYLFGVSQQPLIVSNEHDLSDLWGYVHGFSFFNDSVKCRMKMIGCLGIGCDGAVWKAGYYCQNGDTGTVAVKFQIRNYSFSLEEPRTISIEPNNYIVSPMGRLNVSVRSLSRTKGSCKVVAEHSRVCHFLYESMFTEDEINRSIVGDITKLITPLSKVVGEQEIQEKAIFLARDLAHSFDFLRKKQIIHCDFNTLHLGYDGQRIMNFDLNRAMYCEVDCDVKYAVQMFQYGVSLLYLCNAGDAVFYAFFHETECRSRTFLESNKIIVESPEYAKIEEYMNKTWKCPRGELMKEIVSQSFSPILRGEKVSWNDIISRFDEKLGLTETAKGALEKAQGSIGGEAAKDVDLESVASIAADLASSDADASNESLIVF